MPEQIIPIWNPETGITDISANWRDLQATEVKGIRDAWRAQREDLKGTSQLDDFTERLSREWAIETGILENLYELTRGVTVSLIERGFQADLISHGDSNKPRDYVIQLLRDQKEALEGVFDFVSSKRELSVGYIKELHAALLRSQTHTDAVDSLGRLVEVPLIHGDWKVQPNYPTRGSIQYAYCPPEHVASEMERLVSLHLQHTKDGVSDEVAAAWIHHRFTQIHPFQDGNGRVARALASLVFVKDGLFPLVVTRDDKISYIDALEAGDTGDLQPLVALFAKLQRVQFRKATAISHSLLAANSGVDALLADLTKAARNKAEQRKRELSGVFDHAKALSDDLEGRLKQIEAPISAALQQVYPTAWVNVSRSTPESDYWYRAQIIENAKENLHYYADTSEFRSWIALNAGWERKAKLVFAFHGIGRPFNGSLVCAPFLEFYDQDEGGKERHSLVPVADEPFIFFYSDSRAVVRERFKSWCETTIAVFLDELKKSL